VPPKDFHHLDLLIGCWSKPVKLRNDYLQTDSLRGHARGGHHAVTSFALVSDVTDATETQRERRPTATSPTATLLPAKFTRSRRIALVGRHVSPWSRDPRLGEPPAYGPP
jgi:hypothetical protein